MINALNLDHRMILGGERPNLTNALAGGVQLGGQLADMRYQGAHRNALAQHGAGALAGDQAAMNALAGFDPQAMQTLQTGALNMRIASARDARDAESTALSNSATRQRMRMLDAEEERTVTDRAAAMDATQRAAELEQNNNIIRLMMSANGPEQWDMIAQAQAPELVGEYDNRNVLVSQILDINDILEMQAPPEMTPAFRTLQQRAAAAGLIEGTPAYQQFMAESGGGTNVTVNMGDGAPGLGKLSTDFGYVLDPTTGQPVIDPATGLPRAAPVPGSPADQEINQTNQASYDQASQMLASIDGILGDQALDRATGLWSWTQNIPGTESYRFGTRVRQIEGQAFLQAFESLKGGGAITEIEGLKATQAIGRLDTSQNAGDYREALNDLREVVANAQARASGQPVPFPDDGSGGGQGESDADFLRRYGIE